MDNSDFIGMLDCALTEGVCPPEADWELLDSAARQPAVTNALKPYQPKSTNLYDPRMILDLAIAVDDITVILPRYGLTEAEFNILSETPVFRRELAMAMREARENGLPFANKAKYQAESYLEVLDELVYSAETPASVRLEAIRSTVKWARLEQPTGAEAQGNAPQINVQINF